MSKRACVLGATGFIGGQIARAATERGWHVRAARRSPTNVGAIGDVGVAWVEADLRDASSLRRAFADCELVFHAAAAYPQNWRNIPAEVEAARDEAGRVMAAALDAGVQCLVYTSSLTTVARYMGGDRLADERDEYLPGSVRSAYYEAKIAMERMFRTGTGDMRVVTLLPTAVVGPGDIKPTTSIIVRDAMRGLYPVCFDGTVNIVDGRDVALAHLAAAERGESGARYIVGGSNIALCDLLAEIARACGGRAPIAKVPRALVRLAVRVGDALPFVHLPENARTFEQWQAVSDARARAELGYQSRPLADTVRDTVAWFRR